MTPELERQPPRTAARVVVGASVGWLGISMIADGVPALLLPFRLAGTGDGAATAVGLVTLVAIALAVVVQPYAGRLSDARGRFAVIAAGVAIAAAGLALLVAPVPASLALGGAVIAVVGAGVAQAGQQPLLPDLIDAGRRGIASGAKNAFDVAGALLGFVVLAALLGSGRGDLAALALALALAGGALVGYVLVRPWLRRTARTARFETAPFDRTGLRGAWSLDLAANGRFVRVVAARFAYLLGIFVVGRFLLLFVAARWDMTPDQAAAEAGGLLALLAALTVAASLPAGWLSDRAGRSRAMALGGVITAVGIALLPLVGDSVGLIGAGALMAVGSALFGAASWALMTDLVAPAESGRLLGIGHVGTAGAAAAAGLFGLLIDAGERAAPQAGYALAFMLAAAASLAGGWFGSRAGRALSTAAQPFEPHVERGGA